MADKYLLRVTAGPTYDPSTHQEIRVNTGHSTHISNSACDANITVRIQNYRGQYLSIAMPPRYSTKSEPSQVYPTDLLNAPPTSIIPLIPKTSTQFPSYSYPRSRSPALPSSSAMISTIRSATACPPVSAPRFAL